MRSNKHELVLGIETSCDDTCAAVVADGREVLSTVVSSQDSLHARFGGVVPEHASRRHLEVMVPAVEEALATARVSPGDLCSVAVTTGPGLVGSLLVGLSTAKALSVSWGVPLAAVNHVEAHAYSAFLGRDGVTTPHVCLTVSGGHTALLLMENPLRIRVVGETMDDSAGEAFDKVASYLGLGYPGGPALEACAEKGDPRAFALPRPVFDTHGFNFSFSGLKTAVLQEARRLADRSKPGWQEDLAASFQAAVVDVLVHKTFAVLDALKVPALSASGGVVSNRLLRKALNQRAAAAGVQLAMAAPEFCTDNAAMVAGLGWHLYRDGCRAGLDLDARPGWRPGEM